MSIGLLPYQVDWVRDRTPLKVYRKSRRIGISWSEAYAAVMHAAENRGTIRYLSFRKDITRQFIEDCAYWVRVVNAAAGDIHEHFVRDEDSDIHVFDIRFANGRRIEALSNAPAGFRSGGKAGDWAIIDEAEFVKNIEDVLASALAYLIWGGEVHIISSVDIDGSEFDRLCKEVEADRKPGSLHTTTFRDAIDHGLFRRICARAERDWSEEAEAEWEAEVRAVYGERAAQELDCITRSGDEFWLSWKLIHDAEHEDAGKPELAGDGSTWFGVDIAARRNLWVAADLEQVGDVLWLRQLGELRPAPLRTQIATLQTMLADRRLIRLAADQTGMGEFAVEAYQDEWGAAVEGVLLSSPRRLAVATALKSCMEDRLLRIPVSEALRTDLRSIRTEQGATGAPRLVGDTVDDGSHGDRFWALALACAAAAEGGGPVDGLPAGIRESFGAFAAPGARPGLEIDHELGIVRGQSAGLGGFN